MDAAVRDRQRQSTADIVARADAAGYEALVFTTDANIFGLREWDQRNYVRPGLPTWRNRLELLRHPRWTWEVLLRHGVPQLANLAPFLPPGAASAIGGSTRLPRLFSAHITWNDVAWLRRHWPRKLIIKGVLSVADAQRAADHAATALSSAITAGGSWTTVLRAWMCCRTSRRRSGTA